MKLTYGLILFPFLMLAGEVSAGGGGIAVLEEARVLGSGASATDHYSHDTVAIYGDTALVGSHRSDEACDPPTTSCQSGSAYVFVRDGTDWLQQAMLVPGGATGGERFGKHVDLEGDTAIVGGHGNGGAVYIFQRSGSTWSEVQQLTPAIPGNFGFHVDLCGDTLLVSHPHGGVGNFVHFYVRNGTTWSEQQIISGPMDTGFGWQAALSGDCAVVGNRNYDNPSVPGSNHGAVKVYARAGTVWTEQQQLVASDAADSRSFGRGVDIDGDRIVVSAGSNSGNPRIYVYGRNGTTWSEEAQLFGWGADEDANSIVNVVVQGDRIIGAAASSDDPTENTGTCYLFKRQGTTWVQETKFNAESPNQGALFGDGLSYSDGAVILGSGNTSGLWPAVIFRLLDPAQSFCDASDGALAACPCSNPGSLDSGCNIQQGTGGVRLDVLSQQAGPDNRVTVTGTGFPSQSSPASIVIRAPALDPSAPVTFGDGLRCVGVPLVRLGAAFASAGSSQHAFGHGTMAGNGTFSYQLWFRNTPAMFCTPDAFNLSNGRFLTW